MTIAATINLLQAINATVTGITAAPLLASYPTGEIPDASLPIALTWPGPGSWQGDGVNYEHDRFYDILVYVQRQEIDEAFLTAKTTMIGLLQNFGFTYLDEGNYAVTDSRFILACGPPVVRVRAATPFTDESDSDEFLIGYAGIIYHGFRFRLQVREEGQIV